MITLYTWPTPNGRKVSILLEELGVPYQVVAVNIGKGEQFAPAFLKVSPNNKIPAIVDEEAGVSVFESGAILVYLAEKYGKFLARDGVARAKALEWLFWQVGGLGPMFGQVGYFSRHAEGPRNEAAIARYVKESERLLEVMDRRLGEGPWLAGADYTIADMACYGWLYSVSQPDRLQPYLGAALERCPQVKDWMARMGARPGVQRGMAVPKV
jgi:GST-like protein